jgi:hypothetical protein
VSDKIYFASKPAKELAQLQAERIGERRMSSRHAGVLRKKRKSYLLYYGRHFAKPYGPSEGTDSEIMRMGSQGELAAFAVNHYRNLIKHTLALTCNEKPTFNTRAIEFDPESQNQCKLGNNILDYYFNAKRMGRYMKIAAEHSQVVSRGWIFVHWDPSMGDPYGKKLEQGADGEPIEKIVHKGDIDIYAPSDMDVELDPNETDWRRAEWCDVGVLKNKFSLAAVYPKEADKIINLGPPKSPNFMRGPLSDGQDSDLIQVRYFVHKTTPALPNGRLLIYAGDDIVLYDGPTPYEDKLPLFRIVPGEIMGTTEGYSDAFDLIGIQEAVNTLVSIAFTNQQANGTQKIWAPDGCTLTVTQLSRGLSFLKSPQGTMPVPLELTATAKEIFEFIPFLQKQMETIFGVNAVSRGDPEALGKNASGVSIAYVQAMAAQYNSNFQQSWAELCEDVGSFILWLFQKFADADREFSLPQQDGGTVKARFNKLKLSKIDRVTVEIGNPLTKTLGGKLQVADALMSKGFVKNAQEYLTVLETGSLDPLLEGNEVELDLIRKENEAMQDGKPVKALVGDPHLMHIQSHRKVYADPELRAKAAAGDPVATQVIAEAFRHTQEHIQLYQTQMPIFSQIAGEPPAPPMGMPMPGAPGPQGETPPPQGEGPSPGAIAQVEAPVEEIPRLPSQLQPGAQGLPEPAL